MIASAPPPPRSPPRRPRTPAPQPRAHEELREQDHGSGQRCDHRSDEDVAVDDVRELVPDHPFELDPVHRLQQPLGDRDRRVLGVTAGRERVRRRLGDDVHPRLGDPRRDRQPLDDVVQPGLLLRGHLTGARRREDHPVAEPVRGERHHERDHRGDHEADRTGRPDRSERVPDRTEQQDGSDDEEPRPAAVRGDLLVHALPGEVHRRRAARRVLDVEELARREPEHVRHDVRRNEPISVFRRITWSL